MKGYRLSAEAGADVDGITAYTTETWSLHQAHKYFDQLEDYFELLANNPLMGRTCDFIRPGLRRSEIGRHVVFYTVQPDIIVIMRVLHQNMLPANYF